MINNANLINKVYFPRLIVPTATVVAARQLPMALQERFMVQTAARFRKPV
jgi:ABC-type polysaccharide/polyol phosphate export permease